MAIHYINIFEICERLHGFDLPKGEAFFMRKKNSLFSTIGATFRDTVLTFFDVYTPDENHYVCIQRMFLEVADHLGYPAETKEWIDENTGSRSVTKILGDIGCGGRASGSAIAE